MLCMIGLHRFIPAKAFDTKVTYEGNFMQWAESWTGLACRCGKREIKRNVGNSQSSGATQNAYDWLNDRPQQAKVLKLVKR